jgi:hypothetical protein
MSFKTDQLASYFPDAYATGDRESLLYKVLDTTGAELMTADAKVKEMLKSHWVKYASGTALDALGAVFGIERRTLSMGRPEPDDSFRQRLMGAVPLFRGGGTVEAVKGAVRAALGLPFDLNELKIPASFAGLQEDIEALVQLTEFSPVNESVNGSSVPDPAREGAAEARVNFDIASTSESFPRIEWIFTTGGGRALVLERRQPGPTVVGIRAHPDFHVVPGQTLVLTAVDGGLLSAVLDAADVTRFFTNLDGSTPPHLPPITIARSEWAFRAESGLFDISVFDEGNTFGPPHFTVEVNRQRLQRLTFDVQVPFFLQQAVADLKKRHNYPAELLVFEGLPLNEIQGVIDNVKAAGVRGTLRFSLNFFEKHDQVEVFTGSALHSVAENQAMSELMVAANVNAMSESQGMTEGFAVGGVFDFSTFDRSFGFQ